MVLKSFCLSSVLAGSLSLGAHAQIIADYNADDQSPGAITVFTDSTFAHSATGSGTVETANAVFNGHQDVAMGGGFLTTTSLFSGSQSRTIAAVYTAPLGDNSSVNPVAGEEGIQNYASWFALESRTQFATGDPYLVNAGPDLSNGQTPVANRLTFALGTYDQTSQTETLYWAYGIHGAVQESGPITVVLNTNDVDFGIGTTTYETSQGNMDIGRVQVFANSMSTSQADSAIEALQADYAAVPEPSSYVLIGASLMGGLWWVTRRSRSVGI